MPRSPEIIAGLKQQITAGWDGPACWLGNRCGHVLGELRSYIHPPAHEPRPEVLRFFLERFARFYHAPHAEPFYTLRRVRQRIRTMSAERREACVMLMGALIHYTDLLTLRVGKPARNRHGKLRGLSMVELAALAGLNLRRCERAMTDLHAAGMVGVHPIAKQQPDGTYRGRAAIRTVAIGIFEAVGLGKMLAKARRKEARKDHEPDKPPKPGTVERGIAKLAWEAAKRAAGIGARSPPGPEPPETEPGTAH